jgi:predicted DNA-binding protein with PD1-like motif
LSKAVFKNPIPVAGIKYGAAYGEAIVLEEPIELVATSGLIIHDDDQNLLPHIHMAMSDRTGKGYGGHLFPGTTVLITVEGAIMEFEKINMRKILDDRNVMIFKPENA